jgi:hypothetical protein
VVSLYPIVPGIVNVPVHLIAALLGVDTVAARGQLALVTAGLVTALAVAWLFLLLGELQFEASTRWLGAVTFALGTVAWSVTGRGLWQHGPSLLFLIGALWCMARKTPAALMWAGVLLGLAIFNRPANAILVLPLAWHVIRGHPETRWPFLFAGAVPVGLMVLYSSALFGSALAMGQGQRMSVGSNPLEGLVGVLFSPARGLFVFSPILLLGLLGLPLALRRRSGIDLLFPLIAGSAGVIALHAAWAVWWGGHSFGYRLLSEVLPCLMILLALAWEHSVRGRGWRVALASVLLVASVGVHALGALVAPCGFDTQPDFIDFHPARLWQVADTELIRCARQVVSGSRY